ncbi:hypothetical protein Tco_1037945 [Tanacetum coccineum]
MANLPPNNDLNIHEDEQAPAAPVGFAPQWIGWQIPNNNNGWLDEDDNEEPEEEEVDEDNNEEPEEDEVDEDNNEEPEEDEADEDNNEEIEEEDEEMEDEEEEEIVAEEESEIIYPYDENKPVPSVIHFSSTYERGESSSAREILKDISKVSPLGLVPPTIGNAMSRIRKLNDQMRERAEVDERIVKRIDKNDLHVWMVGRDTMNLDGAVRECQADISKVISMMKNMSLEFERVRKESRRALELVEWEARFREQYLLKFHIGAMANDDVENDDVEGDDVEDEDDMDDDIVDPSDP